MNMSRVTLAALSCVWLALACGSTPPPTTPDNPPPLDDAPATKKPKPDAVVAPSNELVKQGMDAIQKQDFAAAKQVLTDAVGKDPKDPQAAFYLGVALE